MPMSPRRRLRTASLIAAIAFITIPSAHPAHAASNPNAAPATAAGQWLGGQLVDGGIPGFAGTDWGLTIDVLIALEATGADPAAASTVTDALAANVDGYATGGEFAPDLRFGGATAKLLYAATVAGRDPTSFGGHDLRARTLALVAGAETGAQQGWLKNSDATGPTDGGNMFDQSLAVLGLARSGGVPQPVVDFLIGQQCPDGGFRLFPPADGAPCAAAGQAMDPDTTGMAVQALLAADTATGARASVDKAVAWLLSVQQSSGAFHGSAQTNFPNTNSTGLAGLALAAADETAAAERAADWVAGRQLTPANAGAAGSHAGAIGYTPETVTDAVANGIPEFGLDQWRRATAQAVLVLAKIPLGEVGITEPPPPGPGPSPSASPTTPGPPPAAGGTGGQLPVTGVPLATIAIAGGVAVAAGAALLVLSAGRRREP